MPGAHDGRHARQRGAGHRAEPAIGRTVGVDDIVLAAVPRQPCAQTKQRPQAFFFNIDRGGGNAQALCRRQNFCMGGREQHHVMATVQHAARFGENANFLPAPAGRIFSVKYRERRRRYWVGHVFII